MPTPPRLQSLSIPDQSTAVGGFLDAVVQWPADRWRDVVAHLAHYALPERRYISTVVRDAVLAVEGLALPAWFAADAARTAAELLPDTLTAIERRQAQELMTDAALALLARPALPTLDLAILLAPFLPLHLSTEARATHR